MNKSNKVAYIPEDNYLKSLQNFGEHVKASVAEMLDILDNDGEYEKRFDLKIEMNGKSTTIEMHADAFDRIMGMIETEMEEYLVIHPEADEEDSTLDAIDRAMEANDFETAKRLQNQFLDDMLAGIE